MVFPWKTTIEMMKICQEICKLHRDSCSWATEPVVRRESPGNHGFFLGKSSPFMAARFRLVKYDNLPRCICKKSVLALGFGNQTWQRWKSSRHVDDWPCKHDWISLCHVEPENGAVKSMNVGWTYELNIIRDLMGSNGILWWFNGIYKGILWWIYPPFVNCYITNWKDPPCYENG